MKKSLWIEIASGERPADDQVVLVKNAKLIMLPAKAYYDEETNEFISLEAYINVPLSITHYTYMPE